MKLAAFVSGLCIGMVAGATVDRMTSDRKARRAVSKTMERMGKAMDSAFEDVKSCALKKSPPHGLSMRRAFLHVARGAARQILTLLCSSRSGLLSSVQRSYSTCITAEMVWRP